ncbi:MAG: hypothetical protein QXL94_00735 [Candidatus Parvarchaeum sp.]
MSESLEEFMKSVAFHRVLLKEVRNILMTRLKDEFGDNNVSYGYSHDRKVIRVSGNITPERIGKALLKSEGGHVIIEW